MSTKYNISIDDLLSDKFSTNATNIHIHQNDALDDSTDINRLTQIIEDLKNNSMRLTLHTKTVKNIECILDYLSTLYIYINTSNDFAEFLDFDNHLAINDTKNKTILLYINGNNDINIDGVKPTDLPLPYRIVTYYMPAKNIV